MQEPLQVRLTRQQLQQLQGGRLRSQTQLQSAKQRRQQ